MTKMVKNLHAMKKTWVQSLGQEDPLEKGMVTHSTILAWEIPWIEDPGRLQSMGSQKSQTGLKRLNNTNIPMLEKLCSLHLECVLW